ncbi:MAG TPA: choice-of-anchor tandem repeat GloVer-containing protein [Rhizomicrobium sp.]|jgi:uncharacterized repeat protein (TIGR03803 family)
MSCKPIVDAIRKTRVGITTGILSLSALAPCTPAGAHSVTVLHSFCSQANCTDGSYPGSLVEDKAGDFYGTADGGANQAGLIFALTPDEGGGYTYSVLYNFCSEVDCYDGEYPSFNGSLVLDKRGNLYGATEEGGAVGEGGGGEVFELEHKAGQWKLKVLHSFCGGCGDPLAGLTYAGAASGALYDGNSPLYGTAISLYGSVYELQRGAKAWTEQVIYNFCSQANCSDGNYPEDSLTLDASGNLYGTTASGGDSGGHGVAFELSPNGGAWTETVLHQFCSYADCADGYYPTGGVVMDASGNLYSTTGFGGASGANGVAYTIVPNGLNSEFTVLHTFCQKRGCPDGDPWATPVLDRKADVIGTAPLGGDSKYAFEGGGTIFKLNAAKFRVLYKFCPETGCPDGEKPYTTAIRDRSGNLFGTTSMGGANNTGTIYEWTP